MSARGPQEPKYTDPDYKLAPEQYPELNRQFYEGFHQELITTRLGVLCVMHETPEALESMFADGVSWGELTLSVQPEDGSADRLKRNAELELVALRQHAAETLFRVFWVHCHAEPCPWIALARFRTPNELWLAATSYLGGHMWKKDDDGRRFHARAIWGATAVDDDGVIKEQLRESVDCASQWIARAAALVRETPLYNAYKHGLAVFSSPGFALHIGRSPIDGVTIDASEGFTFLERATDDEKRRHYWQQSHESVDFTAVASETAVFATLIGAILDAGALDRGVTHPPIDLAVLSPEATPGRLLKSSGSGPYTLADFKESLLYRK
jgi:hypothetical protein